MVENPESQNRHIFEIKDFSIFYGDFMAVCQQPINQMAADEASAPRDKYVQDSHLGRLDNSRVTGFE